MNQWIYCLLLAALCTACKSKRKKTEAADNTRFFPVLSFLQSQVKEVDTSLYTITVIETVAGRSDTVIIPRERLRNYASDFLEIPDITQPKWKGDYSETTQYDTMMGRAFLIYTANDAELLLQRQDVTITPSFGGNDEIKTVFVHTIKNAGDSTVEKKMYWVVNDHFIINTIVQRQDGSELVRKRQVFWRGQ